jgi:3-oxoacyl-[acyl-carrier protein] reductase
VTVFRKSFESIQIGETESIVRKITEADIKKFVEMTGDDNPLHVDRKYAETTPFKDIVVHGMLGASFISTIIGTKLPGEGALWMSQSFEFLLPVRLGDELTISCTVLKKIDRDRVLELEAKITNQNRARVLAGTGKVKLLEVVAPKMNALEGAERKRVAIVTGGAGGIGRAICKRLAQDGFSVVVNYLGSEAKAKSLVEEIESAQGKAIAVQGDVSSPDGAKRVVEVCLKVFGGVSVVVNNASPKINPAALDQLEWSDVEKHVNVQCKSAFLLAKEVVPYMKEQKHGKIINISSQVLDGVPTPSWTSYAMGKSALSTLSKYLAMELGPLGIQVNSVSPGMTDTALVGDIPEKNRMIIARQTPLRRLGAPEDVAGAVSYLASSSADFITGETIRINGGQVMI